MYYAFISPQGCQMFTEFFSNCLSPIVTKLKAKNWLISPKTQFLFFAAG